MTLFVLMLNDYPLGVYTTDAIATAFAEAHEAKFFKHSHPNAPKFYRTYAFTVDSEARF